MSANLKAKEMFDAGYRHEEKGLLESLITTRDEATEVQEYYNENCLDVMEEPISREEAEGILKEYKSNRSGWARSIGEFSGDAVSGGGGLIGGILIGIISIIGFVIWQSIKYFKRLIETFKVARIIDKIDKPGNSEADNAICNKYKKLLSNPRVCPPRLMDVACTNKWMTVAGVLMVVAALPDLFHNFHSLCVSGIIISWSGIIGIVFPIANILAIYSALGFVARYKKGGAVLEILCLVGIAASMLLYYYTTYPTHIVLGEYIIDHLDVIAEIILYMYILSNKKNKVLEIVLMGCVVALNGWQIISLQLANIQSSGLAVGFVIDILLLSRYVFLLMGKREYGK